MTKNFLAFKLALADHAGVGQGGRVGAGARAGQAKAGDFLAAGKPRQVVVFLFLGAVVEKQLRRAERIGHCDDRTGRSAAAADLDQHLGMGNRGEFQAAIVLRDDHREETLVLEELPGFGRQVADLMGDLPLVEHAAQFFDGPVEERLLFVASGAAPAC